MHIIVTHASPDWDAITSVWLIKRFLPGWNEVSVQFVPAGQRLPNAKPTESAIEEVGGDKVIHVDTGMGPLDHHQTQSDLVCGASKTWDFIKIENTEFKTPSSDRMRVKTEAIDRIVKVVVAIDHFKELHWDNPTADYHEFSLLGVLEGLKLAKPDQDEHYVNFGMESLDALLHNFENRVWAEKEIRENGKEFISRWGKGIGFSTINDSVIKLSQKIGYAVVVRKDPRKGYVRIKGSSQDSKNPMDLTLVYEKLSKMDPDATWYLHISKRMLLNGTPKNPKMVPTTLSLDDIIKVLENV